MDAAKHPERSPLEIAVIGAGIAGMSAAWLLSQNHRVTVYESEDRLGGHSHTVDAPATDPAPDQAALPVDMGFIVYNELAYPNLTALFRYLDVPTKASDMSFAVSLDNGAMEYGGKDLRTWFAQPSNLLRLRFWSMLKDLYRFYRLAPVHAPALDKSDFSLGEYLAANGFGDAFVDDHLLPQAAAIWSAPVNTIRDYPAAAFIRFCQNHGLLKIVGRPIWRTVDGGSRAYVRKLTAAYADRANLNCPVRSIRRLQNGVSVTDIHGNARLFDHVVIGAHADQALRMLEQPSEQEQSLLGAFRYVRNHAVLHSDAGLMPKRRSVWSSWNYLGSPAEGGHGRQLCVTYWMNRLQGLPEARPLFVTLNPIRPPHAGTLIRSEIYEHPLFDAAAMAAQRRLWSLQGVNRTWYCGAYFGSGFHEDGLQAGLAVAEQLGGAKRPWTVDGESSRIHLDPLGVRPDPAGVAA
jgi:predicted NAD/FAD-binding protein